VTSGLPPNNLPPDSATSHPTAGGRPGAALEQLGQYLLLEKLGQGGMGAVYKAFHNRLKRVVAIKKLPAERMNDTAAVARFHREMEAIGQLDHPHIIRATDAGEAEGHHFLVMEFVDGLDLARLVECCGPLAVADACALIHQAAVGLQYIHERRLVHRDIKPSNLMLNLAGQVKILDLGLARLYHGIGGGSGELTPTGQIMGTYDFMAPEQAMSSHQVGITADIYSLGCTLYKLLTGRPPFSGPEYDSMLKKIQAHAQAPPPPLRSIRSDVPAELEAVLAGMLAKEPSERFATPGEVAEALAPFAAGADLVRLIDQAKRRQADHGPALCLAGPLAETGMHDRETRPVLEARKTPTPPTVRKGAKRRWYLAAAAILLVGGAVAAFLLLRPRPEPPLPFVLGPETARGIWLELLADPRREPREIRWSKNDSPPGFSPRQKELSARASQVGLLGLGEVIAPGYQLRIEMSQPTWIGSSGLFFGYREEPVGDHVRIVFQTVHLQVANKAKGKYTVVRTKETIDLGPEGIRSYTPEVMAGQELRDQPGTADQLLEISIARNGILSEARWGNEHLQRLVDQNVNKNFKSKDYVGVFGTFNYGSWTTFRDARLKILGKD
jgi:serine/threonine protein kinase